MTPDVHEQLMIPKASLFLVELLKTINFIQLVKRQTANNMHLYQLSFLTIKR